VEPIEIELIDAGNEGRDELEPGRAFRALGERGDEIRGSPDDPGMKSRSPGVKLAASAAKVRLPVTVLVSRWLGPPHDPRAKMSRAMICFMISAAPPAILVIRAST
jgi:hypothetical protein